MTLFPDALYVIATIIHAEDNGDWKLAIQNIIKTLEIDTLNYVSADTIDELKIIVTEVEDPILLIMDIRLKDVTGNADGLNWILDNINYLNSRQSVAIVFVSAYLPHDVVSVLRNNGLSLNIPVKIFSKNLDRERFDPTIRNLIKYLIYPPGQRRLLEIDEPDKLAEESDEFTDTEGRDDVVCEIITIFDTGLESSDNIYVEINKTYLIDVVIKFSQNYIDHRAELGKIAICIESIYLKKEENKINYFNFNELIHNERLRFPVTFVRQEARSQYVNIHIFVNDSLNQTMSFNVRIR